MGAYALGRSVVRRAGPREGRSLPGCPARLGQDPLGARSPAHAPDTLLRHPARLTELTEPLRLERGCFLACRDECRQIRIGILPSLEELPIRDPAVLPITGR